MKALSNYLNHLDMDLQQALIAEKPVLELVEARTRARDRAAKELKNRNEELRDASLILARVRQRIGELQAERFINDEEWEGWSPKHQ